MRKENINKGLAEGDRTCYVCHPFIPYIGAESGPKLKIKLM